LGYNPPLTWGGPPPRPKPVSPFVPPPPPPPSPPPFQRPHAARAAVCLRLRPRVAAAAAGLRVSKSVLQGAARQRVAGPRPLVHRPPPQHVRPASAFLSLTASPLSPASSSFQLQGTPSQRQGRATLAAIWSTPTCVTCRLTAPACLPRRSSACGSCTSATLVVAILPPLRDAALALRLRVTTGTGSAIRKHISKTAAEQRTYGAATSHGEKM
jgi:hypothetical protein